MRLFHPHVLQIWGNLLKHDVCWKTCVNQRQKCRGKDHIVTKEWPWSSAVMTDWHLHNPSLTAEARGQNTTYSVNDPQFTFQPFPHINTGCLFHRHLIGQTHHMLLLHTGQINKDSPKWHTCVSVNSRSHVWQTYTQKSQVVNSDAFDPNYQSDTRIHRMRYHKQTH